jgi:hypothetical protein
MRADYFNSAGRVAVLLDLLKQHAKSEKAVTHIGSILQRINTDLLAMPAAYSAIHSALKIHAVTNDSVIALCSAMGRIFELRQSEALEVFATDELVATLSRFQSHSLRLIDCLARIESYRKANQAALEEQNKDLQNRVEKQAEKIVSLESEVAILESSVKE